MNNGNLLNTLLGATSASSGVATSFTKKSRAEPSDNFQQAFKQVRPEVAARTTPVRKAPVETSSNAPNSSRPQRPEQRETGKPTAANEFSSGSAPRPSKSTATPYDDAGDKTVDDVHVSAQANSTAVSTHEKDSIKNNIEVSVGALSDDKNTDDNLLLIDPLLMGVMSGNGIQEHVIISPISADFTAAEFTFDSTEVPLMTALAGAEQMDLIVSPDSVLTEEEFVDDVSLSASIMGLNLSPLLTDVNTVTVATVLVPVNDTATVASLDSQALMGSFATVNTLSNAMGNVAITSTMEKVMGASIEGAAPATPLATNQEAPAELLLEKGELAFDDGQSDNPDFMLLNSKAALNKLAEADLLSQDKTAPITDSTKPALTMTAAIESIARLAEAQSPASRAFVVQTGVPVTVGTPQWSQAVGDKVLWLAAQNVTAAEIRLDPPELGPMQVKVSINQDQVSVTFTSAHPVVREALDQQLNRLREMFSEQGLNLVNVDVSDKSFAQQKREQNESSHARADSGVDEDELTPVGLTQAISMRLVDHYA